MKLALASSSNADEVAYYTQLIGVGDLLAASTSKSDTALQRTGSDDARTLAVGDTPYDILTALRFPSRRCVPEASRTNCWARQNSSSTTSKSC